MNNLIVRQEYDLTNKQHVNDIWDLITRDKTNGVTFSRNELGELTKHNNPLTEQEKAIVEKYSYPASEKTVITYLSNLAVYKKIWGDENKKRFVLKDVTRRLMACGVTELKLAPAIEYFIERKDNGEFPQIGELKDKMGLDIKY